MLKVALLFLRFYPLLAKTRIFFIGNVEHGEIFSKILFVQRDKFCKYLIWYRVEMLSKEESYAKRIELVMSFVYCAISLLFGLDRMKSKIGLEIIGKKLNENVIDARNSNQSNRIAVFHPLNFFPRNFISSVGQQIWIFWSLSEKRVFLFPG